MRPWQTRYPTRHGRGPKKQRGFRRLFRQRASQKAADERARYLVLAS